MTARDHYNVTTEHSGMSQPHVYKFKGVMVTSMHIHVCHNLKCLNQISYNLI